MPDPHRRSVSLSEPVVVIAGGFTAGHVTPGLALAAELERLRPGVRLLFMGRRGGIEESLATRAGREFAGLPGGPWLGAGVWTRLRSLSLLLLGAWTARRVFQRREVAACLSLGSYAALGPGLAAALLRRPLVLAESNSGPGLAHRVLNRPATRVLAGAFWTGGELGGRVRRTGVPVRAEIAALGDSAARRSAPGDASGVRRLLVLGGSLGDDFLNREAPAVAARLRRAAPGLRVRHVCGRKEKPDTVASAYAAAGVAARVEAYVEDMAGALAEADAALSSAGAVSLHELGAAGVPTIAVPLGGAAGPHQEANAAVFSHRTGCPARLHSGWSPEAVAGDLARWLASGPEAQEAWRRAAAGMLALEPAGAAERGARGLLAAGLGGAEDAA